MATTSSTAAAAARTRPALSMKLLIDTKARRVLFAEANKDVVDFLFSLLAMPGDTAVRLLGTESMVGSAGHLYAYVLPGADLDALLRPAVSSQAAASNTSLLRLPDKSAPSKVFFWCGQNHGRRYIYGPPDYKFYNYVTDASGTKCPGCGKPMTDAIYWAHPDSGGSAQAAAGVGTTTKGFVQGVVTYTVMDNLTVTPMSAISSITLLNTLGVRDFGALQEKTVRLGSREGLAILKASLKSKTVLTDVFLASRAI